MLSFHLALHYISTFHIKFTFIFTSNRKKRKKGSVKKRLKRRPKRPRKSGNAWKKPKRRDRP